ncbi:dipeptidyl-peptidase 3 family protein [Proteiniphilum sp. UBA5384]|uniref:dipeptidyl-peptidase 3 family protein n=1 Tax=Proteiniphilum sp. UBA5384 TaxID=1947279 RepID=UPI0025D840FA|nr:dihydrofolate reductase [Proteiniphilum sp. UBA5384]
MKKTVLMSTALSLLVACNNGNRADKQVPVDDGIDYTTFEYKVDRFADIEILRYPVPGFNSLSLQQKELIYYLSQAALEGRDILWDQHNRYNLTIRRVCEGVYENYMGDKSSENWKHFEIYLKRIWMANGIHHHYSEDKILPEFPQEYFVSIVKGVDPGRMPFRDGMAADETLNEILPVMFDPKVMPKRMNQSAGIDIVANSAVNFYEGVSQKEVEDFYNAMKDPNDRTPVSYGLNSKVVKVDGVVTEQVWKQDGMYGKAIERIIGWLEKAAAIAENDHQKEVINSLVSYYRTGDLKTFDDYSVKWVTDTISRVDFINGFIENYADPLGMKATWESMVNFKSLEASERTRIISENAQWFEDNSPIDNRFRKEKVKGISAKVITAAMLGGDCYPATPIGINLPNADWIRHDHGSKSVTIDNITFAYDKAAEGNGFNEEFMWSDTEREQAKQFGVVTDNLHTDLHECLGHGSGKLLPGVDGNALKEHGSTLEETRADLFALYYLADPKLVELGLLPDNEAYKTSYYHYILNGAMTQLTRIESGKDIEEAHMRNRALISNWVIENGKADNVVEMQQRDGKTYIVVNDYNKLRILFGELLAEIQRIKSEGDYEAGKNLVEKYAVKVNANLHKEVLARYEALDIAPYKGFVNPVYKLVTDDKGKVTDVTVSYNENYIDQQLRYSRQYSVLPLKN